MKIICAVVGRILKRWGGGGQNSISHEYLLRYHETLFANVFKINPRVVLTQELTDIRTFSKKHFFGFRGVS